MSMYLWNKNRSYLLGSASMLCGCLLLTAGVIALPASGQASTATAPVPSSGSQLTIQPDALRLKQPIPVLPKAGATTQTRASSPDQAALGAHSDLSRNGGFSVNPFTGAPRLRLPLKIGKGSGVSPQLALTFDGQNSANQSSGWSIAGALAITDCFASEGLCLGDIQLMPVKSSKTGSLYRLADDPLTIFRQSGDGYSLSMPTGETRRYEATPKTDRNWRLKNISDPFGNYVEYNYLGDSNWPLDIFFGHKEISRTPLRKVEFAYDLTESAKLTHISSTIGNRIVQNYRLDYDDAGDLTNFSECDKGSGQNANCISTHIFQWKRSGASSAPVLQSVENLYGAVININYADNSHFPLVASYAVTAGNDSGGKTEYHYDKPILGKNNLLVGFERISSYNPASDSGNITTFGTGKLTARVLSEGTFRLNGQTFSFDSVTPYFLNNLTYEKINSSGGEIYVLSKKTQTILINDGKYETTGVTDYHHDSSGRLISVHDGDLQTTMTYQPSVIYPSLIASETITSLKDNTAQSKTVWNYKFAGKRIDNVTAELSGASKSADPVTTFFDYDPFGNVIKVKSAETTTEFVYESSYRTFPILITRTGKDERKQFSKMSYDIVSGEIISMENELGNRIDVALDDLGRAQTVTTTTKLPASEDGPAELIETNSSEETRSKDGQLLLINTRQVRTSDKTEPLLTVTQKSYLDKLGRVTKMQSATESDKLETTLRSSVTKQYLEKTVISRIEMSDGRWIEQEKDYLNRLLMKKTAQRGEIRFEYSDDNLVSAITRNGEKTTFAYDDRGRLEARNLPGVGKYSYSYDELFVTRPASVTLPGGEVISYEYYTDGSRKSKTVSLRGSDNKTYHFKIGFTYKNQQLESITYPDSSKIVYTHDGPILKDIRWAAKAPDNWTDIKDPIASYRGDFDAEKNLVLERKLANGVTEQRKWNKQGQMSHLKLAGPSGHSILEMVYDLDDKSRQTNSVTRIQGDQKLVEKYEYDSQKNLSAVLSSLNGKTQQETFAYDDAGSLIADKNMKRTYDQSGATDYRLKSRSDGLTFKYDANGNLIEKRLGNTISSFEFDSLNQLRSANISRNGKETISTMSYDETGERLIKKVEGGDVTAYIDRFYEVTWRRDGSVQQTKYVPDPLAIIAAYTEKLSADELQKFIPATIGGSGNSNNGGNAVIPQEPSLWQTTLIKAETALARTLPQSVLKSAAPMAVLAIAVLFLLAFDTLIRRYFEGSNRISGTTGKPPRTETQTSFVRNHRIMAALSPVVLASFLTATLAPTAQAALLNGDGIPAANTQMYFHQGAAGNILLVTDSAGKQSTSMSYSAYGMLDDSALTTGENTSRHKFARMEYDASIGLYYDHARYYDPDTGRFVSPDPAHASKDPYNYANSDPVNFVDVNGRQPMLNEFLTLESASPDAPDNPAQSVNDAVSDQEIINGRNNYLNSELNTYRQLLNSHSDAPDDELTDLDAVYQAEDEENEVIQNYTIIPPSFWWLFWRFKKMVSTGQDDAQDDIEDNQSVIELHAAGPDIFNAEPYSVSKDVGSISSLTSRRLESRSEDELSDDENKESDAESDYGGIVSINENGPIAKDVFFDENAILFSILKRIKFSSASNSNQYDIDQGILEKFASDPFFSIDDDKKRYNKLARSGIKGLSLTGSFTTSLTAAFAMAKYWPTYNMYADEVDPNNTVPFEIDIIVNLFTIFGFIGFGKLTAYLESTYWNNRIAKDENNKTVMKDHDWRDYIKLVLRRNLITSPMNILLFIGFAYASQFLRGYPLYTLTQVGYLLITYVFMIYLGTNVWLAYLLAAKKRNKDGSLAIKITKARELGLKNTEYSSRSVFFRAAFQLRRLVSRSDKWETSKWWYPVNSAQAWSMYNIGFSAFYMGYYLMTYIDPILTSRYWFYVVQKNLMRAQLGVSSSPLAVFTRIPGLARSFTIIKKRSPNNPRAWSFGLGSLIGPYDGIRLFRYDDTSYLPEVLWRQNLKKLEIKQLKKMLKKYDYSIIRRELTAPNADNDPEQYEEIDDALKPGSDQKSIPIAPNLENDPENKANDSKSKSKSKDKKKQKKDPTVKTPLLLHGE